MKPPIATAKSLTHLSWSPNGNNLLYLRDRESVVVQQQGGSPRVLASGNEPSWLGNSQILYVKDHEVWSCPIEGGSPKLLYSTADGFLGTHKGRPAGRADGEALLLVIRDVPRDLSPWVPSAAYPVRHFWARGDSRGGPLQPMPATWYGGHALWLPDGKTFAHDEFDATGGARLHITHCEGGDSGKDLAVHRGYMPQLSPDGKRLACVRHAFDGLSIVTIEGGDPKTLELPEDLRGGRFNNPGFWLDDERVLLEAQGTVLEWSLSKPKAPTRRVEISVVRRGLPTMAISPDRKTMAYESKTGEGVGLVLADVSDWLSQTLPEPKTEPDPQEATEESNA
jgi:hypothetical protein